MSRCLTVFWIKENDFISLEIRRPRQKTRIRSKNVFGHTLFFKITTTLRDTFVPSLSPLHPYFGKLAQIARIEVRICHCNNWFIGVKSRSLKHEFWAQKEPKIAQGEVQGFIYIICLLYLISRYSQLDISLQPAWYLVTASLISRYSQLDISLQLAWYLVIASSLQRFFLYSLKGTLARTIRIACYNQYLTMTIFTVLWKKT